MSTILGTLKEILCGPDGTEGIIQDDKYYGVSGADIKTRINDAVTVIAAGIRMPDGITSPPLPDLFNTGTIPTSTENPYASLPSDYQRKLFMVVDSNGGQIHPPRGGDYYSFALFLKQISKKDFSESGSVYIACVKGAKLYYQAIASTSQDLTVHFYRKPVDMSDDDDPVNGIPDHLAKRLIQHYVAKEIFGSDVEDGDNSQGVGFKYHSARFYEAMTDLIDFVGIDETPIYHGSNEGWEW